jgi:hypothetical protein
VDANGKTIVAQNFVELEFTAYSDLFKMIDTIPTLDGDGFYTTPKKQYGLVDNKNKILINADFDNLKLDTNYHRCFWATVNLSDRGDNTKSKFGFFQVGKGWLLDTNTTYQPFLSDVERYKMVYQKDKKQQIKQGIYNASEKVFLLNTDYEAIKYFENYKYIPTRVSNPQEGMYQKDTLFACCKQKKWGLFDPKQKKWLIPLQYDTLVAFNDSLYWVLYEGKYQFINDRNQLALDEKFDKMGSFDLIHPFHESFRNNVCFVPQKDSMIFYNIYSFPKKMAFSNLSYLFREGNLLKTFEYGNQKWSLNRHNRLIMSPDYELLMEKDNYLLTRHKASQQQYLIDNQGNKQLFLSKYLIQSFDAANDFVLVADAKTKRLGAMSMQQKIILPCTFFAVSNLDSQGIIWARKDFSMVKNTKKLHYAHELIDSNWQMYDKKGALLTQTAFDYPFLWATNHLGIGRVHGKQGIWNTKGQNILPAQYDNIEYDLAHQVFYLFGTTNERKHCIGFANAEGQLVVNKNLLNMSFFSGNNAFVETKAGYGIIQKKGNYLVTPEQYAFQKASFRIMPVLFHEIDSLDKVIEARQTDKSLPQIRFLEEDIFKSYFLAKPYSERDTILESYLATLKSPFSQMLVEHLMLELILPTYFLGDYHIYSQKNMNIVYYLNNEFHCSFNEVRYPFRYYMNRFIEKVACHPENATIHLDWMERGSLLTGTEYKCNNYQLENNIWKNKPLSDILVLNEPNRAAVNQLLMNKIGALKNQAIDCSNPAAYLKTVENCFHLLPEGLNFFFKDRYTQKVPILLTWAELKPFLKE